MQAMTPSFELQRHPALIPIDHGFTANDLIAAEREISDLWESGRAPFLIHLSGGNEKQLLSLSRAFRQGDWFFSTHRNHYHYLLAGGSVNDLCRSVEEGYSMFQYNKQLNFFSSSILAGTCPIAVGVAQHLASIASHNYVFCFLGDGAEEQGGFHESVLYATAQNLPILFVIEDNDRSVESSIEDRTRGFRLCWPESHVYRYHYTPQYPHAGNGTKNLITFDKSIKPPSFSKEQ